MVSIRSRPPSILVVDGRERHLEDGDDLPARDAPRDLGGLLNEEIRSIAGIRPSAISCVLNCNLNYSIHNTIA